MSWSTYYENLFKQLLMMFLPALLKTGVYYLIFRKRGYKATITVCFLIAFIPGIVLMGIPVHIPMMLSFFLGIIIGVIVLNYFTRIDIFPAGLTIIVIVESIFRIIQDFVL